MTPEEYISKLRQLRDSATEKAVQQILVPNGNELLANIKNRIVRDKKNSSGGQIGTYSTKPMYASQKQFDKKSAFNPGVRAEVSSYRSTSIKINPKTLLVKKGKTNYETISKQKMKTMYLQEGYKQLRDIQGKPTDGVNVNYTGSTNLSYQLQAKGKEVLLGFTDQESSNIRQGLENGTKGRKGYGKIYYATQQEIANYNKNVAEDSKELTLKILRG